MKYLIKEKEFCNANNLLKNIFKPKPVVNAVLNNIGAQVTLTNTGRVALRIILDYFISQGRIEDKNTKILVPRWICNSVYHTIHKVCFPVLTPTPDTRGVLVYHQYGFPQNMHRIMEEAKSNNWFMIENCANAYESYYKGKRLGTFGEGSIFSFSKFFPSIQGGAMVSTNKKLADFAENALKSGNDNMVSILAHSSRYFSEKNENSCWSKVQEIAYARIESAKKISNLSLNLITKNLNEDAIKKRKDNFKYLKEYFKGKEIFNGLEEEDVVPYVVPLFAPLNMLDRAKNKMLSMGIYTGIYHFDINRNILDPCFIKCMWVPVHQGLSEREMETVCRIVREAL
jgi:dTDP-4-amino-4,6-dideoxygalactose transaminase